MEIWFLMPRGLISILLFYSIPEKFNPQFFNQGILFLTIIFAGIIMAVSLLHWKWQHRLVDLKREHVYEAYGRFIPEEWVPESTVNQEDR
jgi:hypothetical protein